MNPWLILGAAIAIGGAYTYGKFEGTATGLKQGRSEIQQKWDNENARLMEEHAVRVSETLRREQELHIEAENARLEKNRALREVNARAVAVTNLLRDRPERSSSPSTVSGTAGSCSGTTGAQLAKGDGEFLVGYSADAAKLQAEFDQCLRQYDKVRNSILEGNAKLN